ncbi:MAG: T9SS type A sorting domain-containing protein [Bacteroidota bacterium]
MKTLTFAVTLILSVLGLYAQTPGALDGTFNTTGYNVNDLSGGDDWGRSVLLQPNGKIIVAGRSYDTKWNFSLERLLPDGTLDAGFGTSGKVITPMGMEGGAYAAARQTDGKIVLAGYYNNGSNYDFALARYDTTGALDVTFDSDGKLSLAIGTAQDVAHAVCIQPDQKILVAGSAGNGSNTDIALARFLSNGAIDPGFGTSGKLTTPVGTGDDDAWSITLQPNGKILVAGYSIAGSDLRAVLIRYLPNGTLDNTFGTGGIAQTASTGQSNVFFSVERQSDGHILCSGYNSLGTTNRNFLIIRTDTTGAADPAFGTGGRVLTDFSGNNDEAYSLLIQPNGQIVAAGYSDNGSVKAFALARFSAAGVLDNAFGTGGLVTTTVGSPDAYGVDAALQPDGKIVVAGRANGASNVDFAVARYNGTILTGVEDELPQLVFSVYPDPVSDFLNIDLTNGEYKMTILDIEGRVILEKSNITNHEKLSVSGFAPGIYVIHITDINTDATAFGKFIKQ